MSSMPHPPAAQSTAPTTTANRTAIGSLDALYTRYSTAVEALVLGLLARAERPADSDTADDLTAQVWADVTEYVALGADVSWDDLASTAALTVDAWTREAAWTDTETPTGDMARFADPADTAELATDRVDAAGHLPVPRPLRPAATSIAFAQLHRLPLAG
ncbi:hypothetical protein ACFVXH_39750 [Kitasatospora sp. NPDC058184]|uniref:hypothetical protein n=1 Tax=Kitasatospora sp. NPDC058184 TaxID=3346370 RepID=UPI0036DC474F